MKWKRPGNPSAAFCSRASIVIVATLLLRPVAVFAQVCDFGSQVTLVEHSGARFPVTNGGVLSASNFGLPDNYYVVKRQPDIPAIRDLHVGVAGYANGELRMTGRFLAPFMFPGGLDEDGLPLTDNSACPDVDEIYVVRKSDYQLSLSEQRVAESIYSWPADQGAPVIDGDGISGNYDVAAGDRPAMLGDEMAWWKMNDGGRLHLAQGDVAPNVGIEVDAFAAAAYLRRDVDLTLFRYKIRYAGEVPLDSAVVYIFTTAVSGDGLSDAFASDTVAGLGYVYSAADDQLLQDKAPAVGLQVMRGPLVDDDGIDNNYDGVVDELGEELRPTMISAYSELWETEKNQRSYSLVSTGCYPGQEMVEDWGCARNAPVSLKRVHYWAPYDPSVEIRWSAEASLTWRVFAMSMGPFRWAPGSTKTIDFATLWVEGESSLSAAHDIRGYARNLLAYRTSLYTPYVPSPGIPGSFPDNYQISLPHPNPAFRSVTLTIDLPVEETVELSLFNVLGQEVSKRIDTYGPGSHDLNLSLTDAGSGVYYYRLKIRSYVRAGSVVVAR